MFISQINIISKNILNSFFEKGGEAHIGEVREWKNGTYKKIANNNWKRVTKQDDDKKDTYGESLFAPKNISSKLKNALPDKFFESLGKKPDIRFYKTEDGVEGFGPYYHSKVNRIYLNKTETYFDKSVYVHELGHYYHTNKGIINDGHVDKKFKKEVFDVFKKDFDNLPISFKESLRDLNKGGLSKTIGNRRYFNLLEKTQKEFSDIKDRKNTSSKWVVFQAMVESLTVGQYGMGHGRSYYKNSKGIENDEIFAHSMTIYWMGNEIVEKYFPNGVKSMKKYFDSLFY